MRNQLQVALLGIFVILCGRAVKAQQGFVGINPKFLPAGAQQFRWDQGQRPLRMMAVKEGICGLTAVGGLFRGRNEFARVENVGGFWQLSGGSQRQGITATARCVPFSLFKAKASITHFENSIGAALTSPAHVLSQQSLADEGAHPWCWLAGIGGKLSSFTGTTVVPHVSVDYLNRDGFGAVITAQAATTNNFLEGRGACVIFPGVTQPRDALGGQASWRPDDNGKRVRKTMVGMKSGICFLTSIGGDFDAPGDGVTIGVDSLGAQYLYVNAHNWGPAPNFRRTPVAAAQCLSYDQR